MTDTITYGSVCSGIEAATVAWHPLGWRAEWFAEIEPFPSAVLAYRWPDVSNLGDMTKIAAMVRAGEVAAPDILVGGTPCFTAGHMVLAEHGYMPIEDVTVGTMVMTHEGRLRRVVRIGSKAASVGRLSGVGIGEDIACTPDHPFLSVKWRAQNTRRDGLYARIECVGDPEWTAAKNMPGLQWCALTSATVDAPDMPEGIDTAELLYLAGFYLGDGFIRRWIGRDKKAVVFGINQKKLKLFTARVSRRVVVTDERTGPRVTLCSTEIANWLIKNFGEYSHEKSLPAWVLSHPQRSELLAGYLDTDGHRKGNGWRSISVSRSLAYGLRDLSQTLGMVASVSMTEVKPTKLIEGRTVNQRNYWTVAAFRRELSRKSREHHGMLLRSVSAFSGCTDSMVFNIEVEGDHSYVLDGVIVHNCQAFSVAGARAGLADPRGQLTLSYVDLANAIDTTRALRGEKSAIIVWENVPGVLSDKGNAFGCFLGALVGESIELVPPRGKWTKSGCVYGPRRTAAWRVLDAQYFGLAQRRKRVFVVASARTGFDPESVLFEREGVRRDTPPSREARENLAGNLAGGARKHGGYSTDDIPLTTATLDASYGRLQGCSNQDLNHGLSTLVAYGGNNQSGPIDVATARNACASASGRMDFESETFVAHGTQGVSGVRRLTPRECERLMGFPDDYTLIPWRGKPAEQCPDGPRYKAIGNSKAVPVVRWIGRRIQRELERVS